MHGLPLLRRLGFVAAGSAAALVLLLALLAVCLNAGFMHAPLIAYLNHLTGRHIEVGGPLRLNLFSLNPQITAEQVRIGNPPWTPPGLTATVPHLVLVLQLPTKNRGFGIERLEADGASLFLSRDPDGRANWQLDEPAGFSNASLPLIRNLSMHETHLVLDDERRHLKFDGTISAANAGAGALGISGSGRLNGATVSIRITADPLSTASPDTPYHFSFTESTGDAHFEGTGVLLHPFDFAAIDADFEGAGENLRDLYKLAGVSLINSGSFRLAGKCSVRGTNTTFSELTASTGQSDARGTVKVDSTQIPAHIDVDMKSKRARLADFGARAAARQNDGASGAEPALLLSDASFKPETLRRSEAVVNFHAEQLDVGRVPLHQLNAKANIDHGVLRVERLTAEVLGGSLTAHMRLDANRKTPVAEVDMVFSGLQLAQLESLAMNGKPSPLEGILAARVDIRGSGTSAHQIAASANGTVIAAIPQGTIRASLAELTGVDLRGLGLILTKSQQEAPVRCALAKFAARDGVLRAQNIIIDTSPVLIAGHGNVDMHEERLDFLMQGNPKGLRLFRLQAPLQVRGTLRHPTIDLQPHKLQLIDPGHAQDADCAALLAEIGPPGR
jgi:AsmA family protein